MRRDLVRRSSLFPTIWQDDWFSPMQHIQGTMNRMFNDLFGETTLPAIPEYWAPAVNMYQEGDNLVIEAALPGFSKEEVEVTAIENTLQIKGEHKSEEEKKQDNFYCREIRSGSFMRTLEMPAGVNTEQVKASFKDGILKVTMPQKEEAKSKTIKIDVE